MPFQTKPLVSSDGHCWAVVHATCELANATDALVSYMVDVVRTAYGAQDVLAPADPAVAASFDLTALERAFRMGLPNPVQEGNKPPQLTNYRSETCELVAREALKRAHGIEFPTSPQATKGNPDQPIHGFDGHGLLAIDATTPALVVVQVKGTDDPKRPPGEADKLILECHGVAREPSRICRTLTAMLVRLSKASLRNAIRKLLEQVGKNEPIPIFVAPVIVRGHTLADIDDLSSLKSNAEAGSFRPALARGAAVSIGAKLEDFGRLVMERARAA